MSSSSFTASATGAAPSPTSAAPKLSEQLVKSSALVWRVSLFIYAIIAVFVVLRIPHLVGLFGTSSEWYNGHVFRWVRPRKSKSAKARVKAARAMQRNDSARTVVGDDPEFTKDTPVTDYHRPTVRRRPTGPAVRKKFLFPAHVSAVLPFLRPLLSLARSRVPLPGYSVGQLSLLLFYFVVLLAATLYQSSPFIDATRPAWVAVSQVPLVLALAQKNNVLGSLLGYGYERLNYIHRFVGKLVILGSNLHAIFYLYRWTANGTFARYIMAPKNAWGMALLVAMDVLYVFSTPFWRKHAYNVFIWSHTLSVLVIIPAIYMHQPSLWIYAVISAAIYGFDRTLRLVKTRITTAVLTPESNDNVIRIQVPSVNAGWRAGQHVRLRVLRIGGPMGLFGWMEVHPFTIASASVSTGGRGGGRGDEGMVLIVKKAGDWTGRLARLAASNRYQERDGELEPEEKAARRRDVESLESHSVPVRVWLEGPYGGCGRTVFSSFSGALLVCGGSGISFGLSILQDLVAKDAVGESRLKYIELIWVVPEQQSLDGSAIHELVDLVDESIYNRSRQGHGRLEVKVSVSFTRAPTTSGTEKFKSVLVSLARAQSGSSSIDLDLEDVDVSTRSVGVHPNVVVSPGRPRLAKALDTVMAKAAVLGPGDPEQVEVNGMKGVIVGVCGPAELGADVVKTVGSVDASRKARVGGIEVHEETFGM